MPKIDSGFFDIGYMDSLSRQKTFIHDLDPRTKLLTTLIFITFVVSYGKYELSTLFPFILYPVFLCSLGNIPYLFIIKRILLVSPLAIMIGIFNPLIDTQIYHVINGVEISGGWVSFFSILLRFILTVGSALSLIAVTGFSSVCMAMDKLGIPRVFTVQLMFLHRYLFVLIAEASRMVRASSLRKPDKKGMSFKVFGSLLGHLLLRTLDRAQRIHLAMHCRGFNGQVKTLKTLKLHLTDFFFFAGWVIVFIVFRLNNLSQLLGKLVTG